MSVYISAKTSALATLFCHWLDQMLDYLHLCFIFKETYENELGADSINILHSFLEAVCLHVFVSRSMVVAVNLNKIQPYEICDTAATCDQLPHCLFCF